MVINGARPIGYAITEYPNSLIFRCSAIGMSAEPMTKIFVSYRRNDSAYVASVICEKLEQRFGSGSVFYDIDSIPLGTDFRDCISNSVGECDVLLEIIGDHWLDAADEKGNRRLEDPADFVRLELESALQRNIPVVPILVGEADMPPAAALPSSLHSLTFRNAAEVRPGRDLQQHLVRLVNGIEKLEQPEVEQPATSPTTPTKSDASSDESVSARPDNSSTNVSRAPSTKSDVSQLRRKRWVMSALVLIGSHALGWGAGFAAVDIFGGGDALGFSFAIPIWILGIVATIKVWKHFEGPDKED